MDNVILKQHYTDLCEQLNRLQFLITELEPQHAVVAHIQPLTKSQEHEPLNTIEPSIHTGKRAVELATQAYQDLHTIVGFSQKSARRMPGVLWFDTSKTSGTEEIANCVHAINTAKLAIKDYVVSHFSTASERFEILKQACPGVMTVHLYRLIRCYQNEDLRSVRFTWLQQQALVYPDKAKLLNRINLAIEQSSSPSYSNTMATLLELVSAVAPGAIRIRRPVKVQPVANITKYNGAAGPVTAPLPIIILQDKQPVIKIIGEFNAEMASQRKKRSDALEVNLLGIFQGETIEQVIPRN
ncbi:DNA replication terminus site-binding protein [Denitrificimonas caeni]|uniref:DNA replication terminus site-binding protein n=1 Tax=Denitrificimonas caeni TaxID=521720 RepID=UPI001962B487|nr:DNA replication terminus site-binding protein [Denitrificimonas caeni]